MKSILQSAMPRSTYNARRGGRNRRTRTNTEFLRLASTEQPEVHLHGDTASSSRDRSTSRQPSITETESHQQLPIELDIIQDTTPRINRVASAEGNALQSIDTSESYGESEPFGVGRRFERASHVYNPTSEELPHQEECEEDIPFATTDLRRTFCELMSEDDGDIMSALNSRSEGRRQDFLSGCSCYCPCGEIRMRKPCTILTLMMILFVFAVSITILIHYTKNSEYLNQMNSDSEILLHHEWPIQGLTENDSFKSTERDHQQWIFDLLGNNSLEENNSTLVYSVQPNVPEEKKYYPGLFTSHGHFIDQTIAQNILSSIKQMLKQKITENSSTLDILSWKGEAIKLALAELNKGFNISENGDSLEGKFEDSLCQKDDKLICNITSWFRTMNGSCNNVRYPRRGSQFSPFRRILKPITRHLPLMNDVTEKLTGGTPKPEPRVSAILPLWGMFILHDTLKSASSPIPCANNTDENNNQSVDKNVNTSIDNPNNANVKEEMCESFSENKFNSTQCYIYTPCPAVYPSCKIGPRTSFNLVTSYIDASNIYGSFEERMEKLRMKKLGKMKVTLGHHMHGKGFLPIASEQNETCNDGSNSKFCFISGDEDVNQLTALTALSTLFVRQHNRIAHWLHRINLHWNDERLFQESRRLLIAQIQHITFNEFLPEILGHPLLNLSGLQLEKSNFYELYDPEIDSSVSDAYAGAVGYVFWYSMAVGKVQSVWKMEKVATKISYSISSQILNPEFLMKGKGHLEAIIRGFSSLAVNRIGLEFSPELRSIYIKSLNKTVDLAKLVLEKGRALKLAPYNEWRKSCGFVEIKRFEDFKEHWYPEAYESISKVYRNVDDIDLFPGLLAETPIPSGRVGPTLACLLTDQFLRFKRGDRFWYEGDVYFHHFTESQLNSIRETTLARILCDNTDRYFDQIQQWPMLLSDPQTNPLLSCSDIERIPDINFFLWRENVATKNDEDDDDIINWNFESAEDDHDFTNDIDNEIHVVNETKVKSVEPVTTISAIQNIKSTVTKINSNGTTTDKIFGVVNNDRKNISVEIVHSKYPNHD